MVLKLKGGVLPLEVEYLLQHAAPLERLQESFEMENYSKLGKCDLIGLLMLSNDKGVSKEYQKISESRKKYFKKMTFLKISPKKLHYT